MTTMAAIVLADSVPGNHTFSPSREPKNGNARFFDRALGVPSLYPEVQIALYDPPTITSRMKGPDIDKLAYKAVVKVIVPVADITAPASGSGVQPAPSQAYSVSSVNTWTIPVRSDLLTRKNAYAFVQNLMAKPEYQKLIWDTEGIY